MGSNTKLLIQAKDFPKVHGSLSWIRKRSELHNSQGLAFQVMACPILLKETWHMASGTLQRKSCNSFQKNGRGESMIQPHPFLHANMNVKRIVNVDCSSHWVTNRISSYFLILLMDSQIPFVVQKHDEWALGCKCVKEFHPSEIYHEKSPFVTECGSLPFIFTRTHTNKTPNTNL